MVYNLFVSLRVSKRTTKRKTKNNFLPVGKWVLCFLIGAPESEIFQSVPLEKYTLSQIFGSIFLRCGGGGNTMNFWEWAMTAEVMMSILINLSQLKCFVKCMF